MSKKKILISRTSIRSLPKSEEGASMVEFIVSLLVFVPLFIGIPLLGKYADIKHKTLEASRYAAWERTIYSDNSASWNEGERNKSDALILREAEVRFFSHPQQGLHDHEVKQNPLWKNSRTGESFLAANVNNNDDQATNVSSGTMQEKSAWGLIDGTNNALNCTLKRVAHGSGSSQSSLNNNSLQSGSCNPLGVDLNNGMRLGKSNYAEVEISTPVVNFFKISDNDGDFNFNARSALLSNAWTAGSDINYTNRVDLMTNNQALSCITWTSQAYSWLGRRGRFLYGEGQNSHTPKMPNSSQVVVNGLTYYERDRD